MDIYLVGILYFSKFANKMLIFQELADKETSEIENLAILVQ